MTPATLRDAAQKRRDALDCDNQVARMFDAAADRIEELEREVARLRDELGKALDQLTKE